MATVTIKRPEVEVPPPTFVLELDEDEALDVLAALGNRTTLGAYGVYGPLLRSLEEVGHCRDDLYKRK